MTAKPAKTPRTTTVRLPDGDVEAELGPDVDLDAEVVLLPDGSRLTEARARDIADELSGRLGRPSLTGRREPSPSLTFRVDPALRAAAQRLASERGTSVSQLARDALAEYLTRRAG